MNSQVPSNNAKPDAVKISHAGKTAAKVALMVTLYAIGGLLVLAGLGAEARGASRGLFIICMGIGLCGGTTRLAKQLW
jgi:hypothetical protein